MDQTTHPSREASETYGRFRVAMTGLLVAVASCALIFWGGLSIRDHFAGDQPLRKIRIGNANERRTAADELADPDSGIGAEAAVAALIAALADEDAGVAPGPPSRWVGSSTGCDSAGVPRRSIRNGSSGRSRSRREGW